MPGKATETTLWDDGAARKTEPTERKNRVGWRPGSKRGKRDLLVGLENQDLDETASRSKA